MHRAGWGQQRHQRLAAAHLRPEPCPPEGIEHINAAADVHALKEALRPLRTAHGTTRGGGNIST
eukprot:6511664-Alexandrium_andersonii.AAC.1